MCHITTYQYIEVRLNGCHCADDIFECNFFNENCCISITISLKYVPKGLVIIKGIVSLVP